MSLDPVRIKFYREVELDDGYGGVTTDSVGTLLGTFSGTVNRPGPRTLERLERAGGQQGAEGPGVQTQDRFVLFLEPKPTVTLLPNDYAVPQSGDYANVRLNVIGRSFYDGQTQLLVETVS